MPYLGKRKPRRGVAVETNSRCLMCGKLEKHYVPPSLGERGFFICQIPSK